MASSQDINTDNVSDVINFLKCNVPKDSISNIQSELKKDFVFSKKKSKRGKQHNKRKKTTYLNRSDKKKLGFFNIPRNGLKYNDMLTVNNMYNDYFYQILEVDKDTSNIENKHFDTISQAIYKSDFHGSCIKVIRSKCPSYVGKIGICVLDTKNTFKILSKDNILTTIPKKECIFELNVRQFKLKLIGKQLCAKPAERSTKKVRILHHPDI